MTISSRMQLRLHDNGPTRTPRRRDRVDKWRPAAGGRSEQHWGHNCTLLIASAKAVKDLKPGGKQCMA